MSWRPHGKARIDPDSPKALGVCDRCGSLWNLRQLTAQSQYGGDLLINTGSLVCEECLDTPAPFLKAIHLLPDPAPVKNARPENYALDEA